VLPTGLLLFAFLKGALGFATTPSVFFLAGLMLMLVIYDIAHFSTHYMPASNWLLQALKKQHMLHHFSNDRRRFGVTSPLWDYVFRTHR
jgi:sterol desaturase/sphingolipid hydroxylase (fatty acid hydroxylase superfamily)